MKKSIIALLVVMGICAVLWADVGDIHQTVVLTSWVERRNQEPLIKPVWERVVTATFDEDDITAITQPLPVNGILLKVILNAPDGANNAVTYQVTINDNGDNEIFDSGEQAEILTYAFDTYESVTGTIDVNIGPSGPIGGAVGNTQDIIVTLRGI